MESDTLQDKRKTLGAEGYTAPRPSDAQNHFSAGGTSNLKYKRRRGRGHKASPKVPLFYNWRLNGDIPDRLLVKPVDQWPGNISHAKSLIERAEVIGYSTASWDESMQTFSFLRDLRALGGAVARDYAQHLVALWMRYNTRFQADVWRSDIAARRIVMWVSHYDFFGGDADDEFQDLFFESLTRQARHISRSYNQGLHGVAKLYALKGLLYAGLAFEGYETWVEQALGALQKDVADQVLNDGSHVSCSPARLQIALKILLDVRNALAAAGYPVPVHIHDAVRRMGIALRFFRYNDKGYALFNGAYEGDTNLIDNILTQTGMRGKTPQSLYNAGFERVTIGRTLLMFNGAKPPPSPYRQNVHYAPLSFEMCYGRERVLTSCGSHAECDMWSDAMRSTAAHNMLAVDNRDADPGYVKYERKDQDETCLIQGEHDGFSVLNGLTHKRSLYLANKGHDLRGEENLHANVALSKATEIAVRFHIHPNVVVSKVQDGTEILMRLPGGIGWRFKQAGGVIALEDSIYLGCGHVPRKTKQIVVYSDMRGKHKAIKWALRREG